jgi:hypothetical protein
MAAIERVTVPGGLWLDGTHHRQLEVRAPTGGDEAFLLQSREALPSQRVTALLGRCLVAPAEGERAARALTIGDREALLLHLHRAIAGERMEGVLRCPAPACGARMELSLAVGDLLVPPYADAGPTYEVDVPDAAGMFQVQFHVPRGGEQDDAAVLASTRPDAAAELLLRGCVERVTLDGLASSCDALSPSVRSALTAAMADLDPQAELLLDMTCPECGGGFTVPFDTAVFLLRLLDARGDRLLRDVHTLALHYHWSEREIFELPPSRRARYLELLAGAVR